MSGICCFCSNVGLKMSEISAWTKPSLPPTALHTVSQRGRGGKRLVFFVSSAVSVLSDCMLCRNAGLCVLQISVCVVLLFRSEKSGTEKWWLEARESLKCVFRTWRVKGLIGSGLVTAEGTGRPEPGGCGASQRGVNKPPYIVLN